MDLIRGCYSHKNKQDRIDTLRQKKKKKKIHSRGMEHMRITAIYISPNFSRNHVRLLSGTDKWWNTLGDMAVYTSLGLLI
jgi:hypothetical protein